MLNAQVHPEKAALCQSVQEARHVATQPQVWNAYIPNGSKFVQRGQTSVSPQRQFVRLHEGHPWHIDTSTSLVHTLHTCLCGPLVSMSL